MKKNLLFFTMLFMLIFYGQAQTVTIGTGITGKYTMPVNTFYNYSYVQEIFLASEMGVATGSIYSIAFQYIYSVPQTKNPVTIYLGNTTKTNFSSTSDWVPVSTMEEVFQGSVTFTANSWVTITFTTPFEWDGTSNIVVAILNNNGAYTTSNSNTFNVHNTPNNKVLYSYSNSSLSVTSPSSGYLSSLRNNVRFEYGQAPSCGRPKNFATANIGATEATVSWTTGNVETQWEYVYGPQGTVNLQTAVPITVTDTFAFLSSLNSNTIYDVYVRAICGTESSRWLGGSFSTLCGTVMALPYTENFDAYGTTNYPKPICWDRSTSQSISYPYISTTNKVSVPASFYFNSSATTYCVATTAPFDASLLSEDLMISFAMHAVGDGNIQVGVMSNPNDLSTFERIATVVPSVQDLWQKFNVQLRDYAGTGNRIVFLSDRRNENKNNEIYIDNLSIDYLPTCIRPENVRVTNSTTTSITIEWDTYNTNESEWLISYGPRGFYPVDTSIGVMVYDNPFTITGLTPATDYSFYVRSLCSDGDTTDWTNRVDRSTLPYQAAAFPYFCDFEDVAENANWTLVNRNQTNRWIIRDTVNHTENGSKSLFITNNNTNNVYTNTISSSVWAFRDIQLPEAPGFQLTFDWKALGESCCDYLKIFIGAPSVVSAGSLTIPAGAIQLGQFNMKADWQSDTVTFDAIHGNTVQRLYFLWRNDGSGGSTNPPAAIDNISLTVMDCGSPYQLISSDHTVSSATVSWTPSSAQDNEWEYVVGPIGFNLEGAVPVQVSTPSVDLTDLLAGRTYQIYVRTLCNGEPTAWSDPLIFFTDCEMISQLPYQESFDTWGTGTTSYPSCWKRITTYGTTSPYINTIYSTAPGALYFYTSTISNYNMAILPEVSTDIEIADLEVVFKMRVTETASFMIVGVMNNPSDASTFVGLDTLKGSTTNFWENKVAKFENYTGTGKYIALKGHAPGTLYVDDLSIDLARACDRPENVRIKNISQTTAQVIWSRSAVAQSWEIVYGETGFNPASATPVVATDTIYTLSNLSAETAYDVYVRENCGETEPSYWSFVTSFTTLCNALEELPYTENFDTYGTATTSFPDCWTRKTNNTSTNYPYLSTTNHSVPASLYFYGTTALYSIAALPQIPDQYNINELQLNFYARPSSANYSIQVGVMTDPYDNATFEVIQSITSSETTWKYYEIFFDRYEGNAKFIAFRMYGVTGYYYIDDVELTEAPPCSYPVNITASNIAGSSAMINWSFEGVGVPVSYEVEYCETGTGQWSAPLNTIHRNMLLTGLTENTTYDVRVATNCEETTSAYRNITFTTDCYVVQNIGSFESGTSSTYTIPVNNYYKYTYSQQIYTATELGAIAQNIAFISFKYASSSPMTKKNSVKIYLQHSPDSVFTSSGFKSTAGAVLVYDGPLNCVTGWNKFTLNTPFHYNGTDHLLMTVLDNSGNYDGSIYTFVTHSAANKAIHAYRNGTTPYEFGNVTGGAIISQRNDIRFTNCDPNTCVAPNLFVGTVSPTQIHIFWVAGSTETSWEIEYKLATDMNWTSAGTVSTTTFDINGLNSASLYHIRVRSVCDTDYSTWSTISDRTLCAVTTLPYEENFDSYTSTSQTPTCWTKNSTYTSNSYPSLSTTNFTAPYGFYFYSSATSYTLGILPEFDATLPINTLHTVFKVRGSDTNYVVKVGVMNDPNDTSTFTLIQSIRISSIDTWEDQEVYFTDYTGTGQYIAFLSDRRNLASYNLFYLDNVYVNTAPSCRRPTHVTIDNITAVSADVTWGDNQAGEYVIEYGPTPFEHGNGTIITSSDTTATLDNLTPNTAYTVYVRSVCSGANQSDWSFIETFKTKCLAVTTLPYEENFDTYGTVAGTLPNCWSRPVTYLGYPSIVSAYSVSSPASLRFQSQTQTPTYAVTPAFEMELNTLQLSFSLKVEDISSSGTITVGVMSNPNDPATFEPVRVITPTSTSWTDYEIDLNGIALTGLGNYIAFKHTSNSINWYFWLDNLFVGEINCLKVPNVRSSNITSTGATILWHPASGTDNNWEYVCDVTGFAPGLATPVAVTDTMAVVTNLQSNTTYNIYVRTVCLDGTSTWSNVYSFTTLCGNYPLPFFEDFAATTFPPTCWNRYSGLASQVFAGTSFPNTTSGWLRVTDDYGLAAPHAKINIYGTNIKDWLVTPPIDLTGTVNPTLIFNLALTDYGNGNVIEDLNGQADDQFMVIVSADGGATWSASNATVWNNTATGDYSFNNIPTHGQTVSINLAQYAGQNIKIAFYAESTASNGNNDLHIDSVRVQNIQVCNAPINLIVNGITASGATLAWTAGGGETSWMVEYKKSTATNYVSTTVTTPTYTLADLDPATLYQVRVKAICDATSESAYLGGQFTTETPAVTYTITATAGNGGTIDPSGDILVAGGANKTFTITPNQGYEIRMVTVDQTTELGNLSSYTFNNILANHFIDAQFQTTGIENQDLLNEVTLAPNPTEQFVKLTIQNNRITVKEAGIYDAYGKLIQVINITGSETTINLNHFSNGVYFIRLISDEGLITKKLIKK